MSHPRKSIVVASTLSLLLAAGCEIGAPFEGPGYSAGAGVVTPAEGPFFVATTHLVLADDADAQRLFDEHMEVLSDALPAQPGFVGSALAFTPFSREAGYRTMSVWESEEAMAAWVVSAPHAAAIVALSGHVDSGITASWTITRAEMPPTWEDAKARLDENGIEAY